MNTNKKKEEQNNLSKSQAKRLARQQEVKKTKRTARIERIVGIVVGVVLVAAIVSGISYTVYHKVTTTTADSNYSKLLTDDGMIKDVNLEDYITDFDYESIVVPLSEIEYTDEQVDADVQTQLENHKEASTDAALSVADGDSINIDYTGTIDGVAFDGGSTDGAGSSVTIGSGSLVDDFETQLIGSHPGDALTVDVTFPDDYTNADVAGKDASFAVTVNSIDVLPEFNDEFVTTYFSSIASTTDEYRAYLKQANYDVNLGDYITSYIKDNAAVTSYPKAYVKQLRALSKYTDESTYESVNEMYNSYLGYYYYSSFEDYIGVSNSEYEKTLRANAQSTAAADLTYQYLFGKLGLTITEDEYTEWANTMGTDSETTYGKGYITQQLMQNKVLAELKNLVTVE